MSVSELTDKEYFGRCERCTFFCIFGLHV